MTYDTSFYGTDEFRAFARRCYRLFDSGWYHGSRSRLAVIRNVAQAQCGSAWLQPATQAVDQDRLLFDVIAPAFAQRKELAMMFIYYCWYPVRDGVRWTLAVGLEPSREACDEIDWLCNESIWMVPGTWGDEL